MPACYNLSNGQILMKMVVDTSTIIAVILGEPEKDRLVALTKDAVILAPPSVDWEVGNAFSAMLRRNRITWSKRWNL
jgi:predicted nucleic acid-binding protein